MLFSCQCGRKYRVSVSPVKMCDAPRSLSDDRFDERIIEYIAASKSGVTRRDLCRKFRALKSDEMSLALDRIIDCGMASKLSIPRPDGGRPVTWYVAAKSDS